VLGKTVNESDYSVTLLDDFKHRCVRDLAWVIVSPPLVSGVHKQTLWWNQRQCLEEFNDCLPALQALDKTPKALLEHLNHIKSKRLGLYFEGLVSFWFSSISPNYKLLAKNIQLFETHKKGKHTLGELDFIMQQKSTQKIIHLEVTVKFYLGTIPLEDTYHWFGTNTNDQLGKKLDHLKQQQTQLSNKYPELVDFKIDEQHCLIKGRLFYPTRQSTQLQIPDGICKNHLQGRWIYSSERNKKQQLITLAKHDWLAELDHDAITRHLSYHHDNKPDKATCFAVVEKDGNTSYKEVERIFVLPDDFTFPIRKS
jgi:hypothetical protein